MQPGQTESGLGARLRSIAALLGEAVHTRAALLAAEVDLLLSKALLSLLAGLAAIAFATLAGLATIAATLIVVPESARALAAALSALILALFAATFLAWSIRLSKRRAFSASLEELGRDVEQLRGCAPASSQPGQNRQAPASQQ